MNLRAMMKNKIKSGSIIQSIFLIFLLVFNQAAYAQIQGSLIPNGKTVFLDNNGNPLSSGKVFFYTQGTTTPKTTYQDINQTIPNTNPVILDAAGRPAGSSGLWGIGTYRQVVQDKNNNLIWDVTTSTAGTGATGPTATGDGDAVGTIKPWAGITAPNQYMFTYGQALNRVTYASLFQAITSTQAVFCTSGSPILTGLSNTDSFWLGMPIELSCIPAGFTTIIAKTSNSVTLAVNANASVNTNATFFPWGNGNHSTTFNLPDYRGLIPMGNNIMGGVASSNMSDANFGVASASSAGGQGGTQTKTINLINLPSDITVSGLVTVFPNNNNLLFAPIVNTGFSSLAQNAAEGGAAAVAQSTAAATISATNVFSATNTLTSNNTGSSGSAVAMPIIPPSKTVNFIIKVTPDTAFSGTGVTSLGGMTGDIVCGTGLTCAGNNISVTTIAGVTNIQGMTGAITCGTGIACSGNVISNSSSSGSTNVTASPYNAVDDCVTDNTLAFQNAINAATASGGTGVVYVPPVRAGGCYLVGAINQTNKPHLLVYGNGDNSLIKINGFSTTNHNWWDYTGSDDTSFSNIKVIGTNAIVPKVIFFAAANNITNILHGANFDHVNIDAYSSEGHFYGFNIAYINSNTFVSSAGMTCRNSVWYQRANGGSASSANPSLRTAVAIFDGINSRSLASDYTTVSASGAGTQSINLTNCNFISYPPAGVGAGTKDNNSGLVLVTAGQFEMTNGSVQCLSLMCVPMWTNVEGVRFNSVVFKNSDGGGGATATTDYYLGFGGGTNGFIIIDNALFSDLPNVAGAAAYIGLDVTATQVAQLKVRGVDIGANTYSNKFISTIGGCGGHVAATNQIYQSRIEFWDTNNAIQICDSIDKNTEMVGLGAITQASAGATDASMHIGGAIPSVGFATLPTCNAASYGARRLINNSNTAVFNAAAAGGGANVVYVMCNATAWVVY